jgi:hypothetical protein
MQQQAQHKAAAAAHSPASSTSAEQYHDCHEEFFYDCQDEIPQQGDIFTDCSEEWPQDGVFDGCSADLCLEDWDVDAIVYVIVASCMADCISC